MIGNILQMFGHNLASILRGKDSKVAFAEVKEL